MGRCLIVANQTLGGAALEQVIRSRIEDGRGSFHVVAPVTDPKFESDAWFWGYTPGVELGRAHQRATHRLERVLARIAELGGEATGEVGDSDPVLALETALTETDDVDEVVVSTLPSRLSRWLKMDVPSRVERLVQVPVTVLEAEERS